MGQHDRIRPLSYLKAHSAEILRDLGNGAPPLVITQNGVAKAVLQDAASYDATQETLALLKLLALGQDDMSAGRTSSLSEIANRLSEVR
jgi:prevent-host-death family protein